MHTWHSNKYQPYTYAGYTLFNAEVASTFNEALVMDYLLKKEKDPAKRLYLINQYIDNIRGTVVTQVMFADFELKMHRAAEAGEPLTADALGQMYLETLKSYYGNSVVIDPEYAFTWIRIPHFYRNFYVYKYATSFCASQALSQKVLKGEKGARESYIKYLSSGSSKYPLELLKDAGVDMSTPAPVEATMKKLAELVDEMERLLKQTKRI
jgi:oligoendopeptidase F